MSRSNHIDRISEEAVQLFIKWQKLEEFFLNPLYSTITKREQELLKVQAKVMAEYHNILQMRLAFYGQHKN